MRVACTAVVWLVAGAHFAFLVYLPIGGFLALRWRRSLWLHVAAVLWAAASVSVNLWCPLTALEDWARRGAGMAPLGSAGFIDHYITGVIYPDGAERYVQAAVFTAVAVSWLGCAAAARRRRTPSPSG